ncbi:MAG: hypothetical protein KGL39_31620 [Patescibacteria group bacterium]|nr:hypothetical protein [Patescibacteria group bacterium]
MTQPFAGINVQAKTAWPAGLDILYVLDDWNTGPPKGAAHYRTMSHSGYSHLPRGSHVVAGNEDDDEQDNLSLYGEAESVQQAYAADARCALITPAAVETYGSAAAALWLSDHRNELRRQWRPAWAQSAKAAGMVVHCAAEKWYERYQYEPAFVDLCDVVDVHIAAFEVVGKSQDELAGWWAEIQNIARGKPICISEVETDPDYEEAQLPTIPEAMRICLSLGAWGVFAWGDNPGYANVVDYPAILDQIRALKANPPAGFRSNQKPAAGTATQGETNVPIDPDVQKALDTINKRIADQTEGLRRVVEGKYSGPAGAAAIVVALEGGSDSSIQPQPDYTPKV